MLHLIPTTRLGMLKKAMGTSQASHKYIKRERVWRKGKPTWRYWYADDLQREKHQEALDPHKEHDHIVTSEAWKVHRALKKDRPSTSSITTSFLEGLLGKDTQVRVSAEFHERHVQPFVDSEEKGQEVERNPIQRVAKALEMLSDEVRKLILVKNIKITTRNDRSVREMFEHGDPPRPVPAAWSDDKTIILCADGDKNGGIAGFNTIPMGEAKYGKALTLSEEIVWHEIGKNLRINLGKKRKELLDQWKVLTEDPSTTKISAAANQSWQIDFNESFAAMMSHPLQMARQCPERYRFFQQNKLVDVPSIEEILKQAAGEFAWWEMRKPTNAQRLYLQMADEIAASPTTKTVYVSDKDEFYALHVNGRSVYLRIGPASFTDEEDWNPLPSMIDPQTGLPVYDSAVAQRFRAKGIVKEVYDEFGRRLDDTAAWLYLNQDKDIDVPAKLSDYKDKGTHGLGYQMFIAMGENRGNAEDERKAVQKYLKDGTLEEKRGERYQWAPVKMNAAEFHAKTPSFSFAELRSSDVQPYVKYENGKPVISPETKKPILTARVYEATNPDGTRAQIVVQEASEFEEGEIAVLPVSRVIVDEDTGEERTTTEWTEVELTHKEFGADLSARALARHFKVPVDDILGHNGKVGQYQIQDPMMAALVNPDNSPLTSREDLVARLRYAAEAQPEKWVTVEVGDELPRTSLHIKVKFDGAGSPLLVGDYWQRKLGIPNPRVSDLIDAGGITKVDKAVELKPQKRRIQPGHTVYAKIDGHMVLATLTSREVAEGKRKYTVNVLPNQAIEAGQAETATIRAIPSNIDPSRPSIRKRRFRAPLRDLLLFADEVQVNPQGDVIQGSGIIKVKLPQNGQFTFEEVARAPGIRVANGELILDPEAVPAFREHMGGFIMDDHVRTRLNRKLRDARIREKAGREKRIQLNQICETDGTLRVDGIMKGLRPSIKGDKFRLGSHQAECLQQLAQTEGRLMAAHGMGTGKTVTAIAGIKMMQNLNGYPKRCLVVAPKNTVQQWDDAVRDFTFGHSTVIGSSDIPGAKAMWVPPKKLMTKPADWSDEKYHKELDKLRREAGKGYWDPNADGTDIVVVPQEYFAIHEAELRRFGGFDGIVVDEAQGVQRENKRSDAVDRWNPDMKFLMLLSGTPVTNTMATLANYLRILSAGQIDLGTPAEFERNYMVESSVLKAAGSKTPSKMDINPIKLRELMPSLKKYIHIATAEDVKGKVMPAILTDENTPAHMEGIQSMLYRGYMRQLTPDDRNMLAMAAALGEDEQKVVSKEGRRSIRVGRNIANTLGYKPLDGHEYVSFESGLGKKKKDVQLRLPTWNELRTKFSGRLPSMQDVVEERIEEAHFTEMSKWLGHALGVDYDTVAGKKAESVLDAKLVSAWKAGNELGNGIKPGERILNPEFGPEGAICRGQIKDGKIVPLEHVIRNADGSVREIVRVPVGTRFIRNPAEKSATKYYIGGLPESHPESKNVPNDWDYSKVMYDTTEDGTVESKSEEESAEDADVMSKAKEKGQRPKAGREGFDVNTNPARRRERLMLDLVLTTGNAKCDAMETWIDTIVNPKRGGKPDAQIVVFAGALGSGCRTVESKLRMMGYQDVNEALNNALKAPDDSPPATGKYFVSYLNNSATLGDRDVNSDIFKKAKDATGRDLNTSMFVQRTMYGVSDGVLKEGQIREGWNRESREKIAKLFTGVEVPARVALVNKGGTLVHQYAYDSALNDKDRIKVKQLENELRTADDWNAKYDEISAVYRKYLTDKSPLTDKHIHVFNNCQLMVASDAARVGMNWGNATTLGNYDSLFSPMDEAQRATRVARMLPGAISPKLQGVMDALETQVRRMGTRTNFAEYSGTADGAVRIVTDAINALPEEAQHALLQAKTNGPQFAEAYLAQRALDKMRDLRSKVSQQLRAEGRVITTAPKVKKQVGTNPDGSPKYEMEYQRVASVEITEGDITNELIEKHLQPFEREILRSRKYLKDVKRFVASIDVPEMETKTHEFKETNEETGKTRTRKVKMQVPTGHTTTEVPCHAERSQLTRGRAKQVPVERLFAAVQNEDPISTAFDFIPTKVSNLVQIGHEVRAPKSAEELDKQRARKKRIQEMRRQEAADRKRLAAERRAMKGAA